MECYLELVTFDTFHVWVDITIFCKTCCKQNICTLFSWCGIDSYIQLRALFWFDTHRSIFYFKFKHYTVTRPKASGSSFRFKGEVTGLVKDRDKTGTRQGQDRDKTGQDEEKAGKR